MNKSVIQCIDLCVGGTGQGCSSDSYNHVKPEP